MSASSISRQTHVCHDGDKVSNNLCKPRLFGQFFVVRRVFFSICLLSVLIKNSFPLSIAVMLRGGAKGYQRLL